MEMKIRTEKYQLVVDDADIKVDTWVYHSGVNRVVFADEFDIENHDCYRIVKHLPLMDAPILGGIPIIQ